MQKQLSDPILIFQEQRNSEYLHFSLNIIQCSISSLGYQNSWKKFNKHSSFKNQYIFNTQDSILN